MSDLIRYRVDLDGDRHRVVVVDGRDGFNVRVTTSCSGCYEPGEYCGMEYLYPYDSKAGCRMGNGCHECGYTGKRRQWNWVPFDIPQR